MKIWYSGWYVYIMVVSRASLCRPANVGSLHAFMLTKPADARSLSRCFISNEPLGCRGVADRCWLMVDLLAGTPVLRFKPIQDTSNSTNTAVKQSSGVYASSLVTVAAIGVPCTRDWNVFATVGGAQTFDRHVDEATRDTNSQVKPLKLCQNHGWDLGGTRNQVQSDAIGMIAVCMSTTATGPRMQRYKPS